MDHYDYISILLEALSEFRFSFMDSAYHLQLERERRAYEALHASLTEAQYPLLLAYEEARNATASIGEDLYARQVFLLAREIFR